LCFQSGKLTLVFSGKAFWKENLVPSQSLGFGKKGNLNLPTFKPIKVPVPFGPKGIVWKTLGSLTLNPPSNLFLGMGLLTFPITVSEVNSLTGPLV